MSAMRINEQISGLVRDYQNNIRTVEAERNKFVQKYFDQNSKIETLSKRARLAEDRLIHRDSFAKQAVKTLKLVSKERDSLAYRLKIIESEKSNCEGENESFSNIGVENIKQTTKSQIPRSKECFLAKRKVKSNASRFKVLPPLDSLKKKSPPTNSFTPLSTLGALTPTPPSLLPPVKRRATKNYVSLTNKQPANNICANGELNPYKILPPVLRRPSLQKLKTAASGDLVSKPRQRE